MRLDHLLSKENTPEGSSGGNPKVSQVGNGHVIQFRGHTRSSEALKEKSGGAGDGDCEMGQ